ncbi:MAG: rhodanese-like domain-containing protein [Nitrosarchaeum sp.]|jgi:glyoxylase-like metal-dependent hydrolase (beta-lactamase superfamily II)/rhodanese-related sulfurtransferase|uniref:rhodanese-like domain-containing protein n=1 Tax=Nitrosarchaeum sp. TaxID=2026886 RepID=UPI002DF1F20F|nr:rhodanese-like domain-containing protein [Nitrosarchaeum sp.]
MEQKQLGISSKQLEQDMIQQKPFLLFDLRTKESFEKSHVPGSVHAVCDTNAKETILPKIPKNAKIILISDPEEYAKETAQMMKSFGLDVYFLIDGFSSWKGTLSQGETGKTISADNLAQKLDNVFLLDVRDRDEYSKYQITGSVNIPLSDLFDAKTISKIPKNKEIVTICPHGNRAMIASFALARVGIDSKILTGGLAGWNQVLKPVTVVKEPVQIIQVQKIGKGCLSHIVESDGEAIVIDPLYPFEKYTDIAKEQGFQIIKVMDTHQHADHVSAAKDLAKAVNAKLYLSKYEGYVFDANFIGDAEQLQFGKAILRIIHTPGHTHGSLSYVIDEKYVFTGDILFVESIGRPDLRDKVEEFTDDLYNTLHNKLLKLPHNVMVFPTHHSQNVEPIDEVFYSTIEQSKKLPWLDIPKREFIKKIVSITLPRPMNYQKIIAVNKGELELKKSEIPDLEIGPNRCAIDSK